MDGVGVMMDDFNEIDLNAVRHLNGIYVACYTHDCYLYSLDDIFNSISLAKEILSFLPVVWVESMYICDIEWHSLNLYELWAGDARSLCVS